jgi:Ca2+-binding RTX toxin-like protein
MRKRTVLVVLVLVALLGLTSVALAKSIVGTNVGETLRGTNGDDHILAKAGNDVAIGRGADDLIRGQQGDDTLYGDEQTTSPGVCNKDYDENGQDDGEDEIWGGPGDDFIDGGGEEDEIWGGPGDDTVCAVDGQEDEVHCGPGDDTVVADVIDRVGRSCEHVERV